MIKPAKTNCTRPKYVCGNHRMKLVGTIDGLFPDFGHHLEKEMGGLWLYPVKIIDGFWSRITDHETDGLVDGYMEAGSFENAPHENRFYYSGHTMGHTPLQITRTQFIPDEAAGLQVTYEFCLPEAEAGQKARRITFDFLVRVNLRPDWLAEELQILDGDQDLIEYHEKEGIFVAKDDKNPWFACVGAGFTPDGYVIGNEFGSEITVSRGGSIRLTKELTIEPGEKNELTFYISGSAKSESDCLAQYTLLSQGQGLKEKKAERIEQMLKSAALSVGDGRFEEIFDWLKVHNDWLTLEVEGIGRGITAGIPEYVWWFGCDSCYALQGMMMQGAFELCRSTIQLILTYSGKFNGNGKIIHELLPNGFSPNLGNTQETAHFLYLIWEYYLWTGDSELLRDYYHELEKSVNWLLEQDDDNDYFPTGYGIIEIAGLNMEMIDTAAYTAAAYTCFGKISRMLGFGDQAEKWQKIGAEAQQAVNTKLWDDEEGLYCDCYASARKIAEKKEMILGQMKESGDSHALDQFVKTLEERLLTPDQEYGFILNRNWVMNVPMETGIAERSKAERALKRMHTEEFVGTYGMYLEGLRKHSVMTISTGVMAVSQARYGFGDRALELIERMFCSFSMATPGSISEMSPDYGCFVQAWTAYGAVVPVVRYFFGIEPDAEKNEIHIAPRIPAKWLEQCGGELKLTNVRVLDGTISIVLDPSTKKGRLENTTGAKVVVEENCLWNLELHS